MSVKASSNRQVARVGSDGDCDTALVRINISNDVPEAKDDTYTVSEDSENNVLDVFVLHLFCVVTFRDTPRLPFEDGAFSALPLHSFQ